MPRRNRRLADAVAIDDERARRGLERVQSAPDGQWAVRRIPAEVATKTYRCPGCDHDIRPGVAHIVAWPYDDRGGATDRRHWHSGCWNARFRRSPTRRR